MWMLLLIVSVWGAEGKCYWNGKCPYKLFGTKTPYDVVRGDIRDVTVLEKCEAVSVWMMSRHGTRRPEQEELDKMKAVVGLAAEIVRAHREGRGDMCEQDIENLEKWRWNEELDASTTELTATGTSEMQGIGQRFGYKFENVLKNLQQHQIRASIEQRTQQSANAFADGLMRDNQTLNISSSLSDDLTARPYRHCKKRFYDILVGPKIPQETDKYLQSYEFQKVQISIQKRTGLEDSLSPKTILLIYDVCRYHRSISPTQTDAWCSLFSDNDLKILEYVEDLQHYYRNGHGDPINSKLGASSLMDLYEKFELGTQGVTSFSAYFSHDTMMGMLYAALGLYVDRPALSGYERIKKRRWRTSFLTPYAANFVAVLNKCNDPSGSIYKVQFFVNEKEVHLCSRRACSWQEFYGKFNNFTQDLAFCNETLVTS
ncbi:multiple inositol polyphosphate phosphatase 1-like [Pieris brassicae]|uniref:multiple inositol polyphosphate phosphatase 1-like n=1 Tax=Pieris brassicae TaxID=7116 RepID=UPI001E65E41A|nr:multiple inositol polyphosphate phosphatase 1-like [Pieris brassicae]